MPKRRSWNQGELVRAVGESISFRGVLIKLNLRPTGGNYEQVKKYIKEYNLNTAHFRGAAWNKGLHFKRSCIPLKDILQKGTLFQSFKLKKRLFAEGLNPRCCEECGWAKISQDGYLPLELDHINGDRHDNRLENLRVLCPNCHSLKPTHRGKNKKRLGGEIGKRATLKMS